jgi:hypothetical protein
MHVTPFSSFFPSFFLPKKKRCFIPCNNGGEGVEKPLFSSPQPQGGDPSGPSGKEKRGESNVGFGSHEPTLAGLLAVTAPFEWPLAVVGAGSESRTDIGLFKSSGRGFNLIKPIFPFYEVYS